MRDPCECHTNSSSLFPTPIPTISWYIKWLILPFIRTFHIHHEEDQHYIDAKRWQGKWYIIKIEPINKGGCTHGVHSKRIRVTT